MTDKSIKTGAVHRAALLDVCVLLALIVCAAVVFHLAGEFKTDRPGDGSLFPRLSSGVVLATAVLSLIGRARTFDNLEESDQGTLANFKPIGVAVMTGLFVSLLPIVGYPILAPLWLGATIWVFGLRSKWKLLAISLGLSAIAWILLDRLAFAPPPAGILENILR